MTKFDSQFEDLQKAIVRLDEVLQMEKTDIVRDSAIKRFEIVFDLAWKALKEFLEEKNDIVCKSPNECFREGFNQKILEHSDFWAKITSDRNYVTHTYKEFLAEKVYADLPAALESFKNLAQKMAEK